jgi:hypothetical protein
MNTTLLIFLVVVNDLAWLYAGYKLCQFLRGK